MVPVLTLSALRLRLVVRERLSRCLTSVAATEVRRRAARRPRAVAVEPVVTQATAVPVHRQAQATGLLELAAAAAAVQAIAGHLAVALACMALALAVPVVCPPGQPHAAVQVVDTAQHQPLPAARTSAQVAADFTAQVAVVCDGPMPLL